MQLEALYMGFLLNTNLGQGLVAQECDHIITCKERIHFNTANSIPI